MSLVGGLFRRRVAPGLVWGGFDRRDRVRLVTAGSISRRRSQIVKIDEPHGSIVFDKIPPGK